MVKDLGLRRAVLGGSSPGERPASRCSTSPGGRTSATCPWRSGRACSCRVRRPRSWPVGPSTRLAGDGRRLAGGRRPRHRFGRHRAGHRPGGALAHGARGRGRPGRLPLGQAQLLEPVRAASTCMPAIWPTPSPSSTARSTLVISNPPYIPPGAIPRDPEVRDYDPPPALSVRAATASTRSGRSNGRPAAAAPRWVRRRGARRPAGHPGLSDLLRGQRMARRPQPPGPHPQGPLRHRPLWPGIGWHSVSDRSEPVDTPALRSSIMSLVASLHDEEAA